MFLEDVFTVKLLALVWNNPWQFEQQPAKRWKWNWKEKGNQPASKWKWKWNENEKAACKEMKVKEKGKISLERDENESESADSQCGLHQPYCVANGWWLYIRDFENNFPLINIWGFIVGDGDGRWPGWMLNKEMCVGQIRRAHPCDLWLFLECTALHLCFIRYHIEKVLILLFSYYMRCIRNWVSLSFWITKKCFVNTTASKVNSQVNTSKTMERVASQW